MKKRIALLALALILALGFGAGADTNTGARVDSIISGNQDYLVFASLGNKDLSYFDVQVIDIIGDDALEEDEREKLRKRFEKSISVAGIDTYMYYSDSDDKPRTGDNVLISLNYAGGDNYTVKNGIFRVDSLGISQFKFEVPQAIEATDEAKELRALYTYVYTDAKINDIVIREDGVYYKKADSDTYDKQADNVGIKFLDEFGDPAQVAEGQFPELEHPGDKAEAQSKWQIVSMILAAGLVLGAFFVKLINKFDKRYDNK